MSEDSASEQSPNLFVRFLRCEAESILQEWEGCAREASDNARVLSRDQLRDSLPAILSVIADHAEEKQGVDILAERAPEGARSHAEHRWMWGFSLEEVTHEYGMLRSIIMKRLSPRIAEFSTEELVFLFGSLDGAIIESVATYLGIAQRRLEEQHDRLEVTLANIGDGVLSTDAEGRITYLNPAARVIVDWPAEEAIGQPIDRVLHTLDEARGLPVKSMSQRTLQTQSQESHRAEVLLRQRNGKLMPAEEIAAPLRDAEGHFAGVVTTIRDVSNIRALTDQLGHMATHDSLTGLPNRALLKDRLMQELAHAERHGERAGVMYLDLDLFKEVNDMLGHTAGDELLKQVAERLQSCIRRTDTVCRVGGDEFIILLTEFGEVNFLGELGAAITARLRTPFEVDGHTVDVSTSIGISVFPEDGKEPETLIKHADMAMYQAKAMGRNNVQFFTREMNWRAKERRELQSELRNALAANQLSLYFQPQVDLGTGTVQGAEVLLRWNHPRLGQIAPGRFIPVAEESRDLMITIGDWVLEEACRQARAWLDAGYPPVRISVNISIMQLRCEHLAVHVADLLERYTLPASQLQLELTESVLMTDVDGATGRVRALEKMGVRIAVDDFGTGYSSLSYLKDLPVDELKIDKSFVHDVSGDAGKAAIVDAVIRMGQSLNLRVIAEGVEDRNAVDFLSAHGCEIAQGFYFSRPLPPSGFADLYLR